jgi:hypothetical protein
MRSTRRKSTTALPALVCLFATACGGGDADSDFAAVPESDEKIGEGQTMVVGGPQSNNIDAIRRSGFDDEFKKRTGADIEWIAGQAS